MITSRSAWIIGFCSGLLALTGCSTPTTPIGKRGPASASRTVLPWEIADDDGAVVVPDIFYADPGQNEQVMPTALDGHNQIDRLIYPTIGNPVLHVKNDDVLKHFIAVLRIEKSLLKPFLPEGTSDTSGQIDFSSIAGSFNGAFKFYLISREARPDHTEFSGAIAPAQAVPQNGIYPVTLDPNLTTVLPTGDAPPELATRWTLKAVFDEASVDSVPPGLYDVRFELQTGAKFTYEYQYNALRIFDHPYADGSYRILNITDTQGSVGEFKKLTMNRLEEFRQYVHREKDDALKDIAFISFNGDLHNGGSPEMVDAKDVAPNYNNEAKRIMKILKELDFPIFLTTGNHDGYVTIGNDPWGEIPLLTKVRDVVSAPGFAATSAWPNFNARSYLKFLKTKTKDLEGGLHVDIYAGKFVRVRGGRNFSDGWKRLDDRKRNQVLFDGFYQWQRTYGPLNHAWVFGDNYYITLNSFELRQHRRSGWGMYTVNYGGGLSTIQLSWLSAELKWAQNMDKDIILLAHHDPRGGHGGKDYPYYFEQVDYMGMRQSAGNYVKGEVLENKLCKIEPSDVQSESRELGCLHDGLQEWMRADPEFDCDEADRFGSSHYQAGAGETAPISDQLGRCNLAHYSSSAAVADAASAQAPVKRHPYYSGYSLIQKLNDTPNLRTVLYGHTHFHSLDVLQAGDPMIEKTVRLDFADDKKFSAMELANPLRSDTWLSRLKAKAKLKLGIGTSDVYDLDKLRDAGIIKDTNGQFILDLAEAGNNFHNLVAPSANGPREIAIIRMTANAEITSQKVRATKATMMGFTIFDIARKSDTRQYPHAQINHLEYYRNTNPRGCPETDPAEGACSSFVPVMDYELDRTARINATSANNPITPTLEWDH